MLKASIDIGSNSILLLILKEKDGEFTEVENCSHVTRLGKNLDKTGIFSQESINDSMAALKNYSQILHKYNIDPESVVVTATEAARVAKNSKEFRDRVYKEFKLKVTIISGEGEAYYTAAGVCGGQKNYKKKSFIIDMGGASTEIIKINQENGFEIENSISLPIGSVRSTDWLKQSINYFNEKMDNLLSSDVEDYKTHEVIAVAGTMTSVAAMIKCKDNFDISKIHNSQLTLFDLNLLYNENKNMETNDLLEKYPFLGKRAENILGGLQAMIKILNFLSVERVVISTYGLRYGVLYSGGINERFIK